MKKRCGFFGSSQSVAFYTTKLLFRLENTERKGKKQISEMGGAPV